MEISYFNSVIDTKQYSKFFDSIFDFSHHVIKGLKTDLRYLVTRTRIIKTKEAKPIKDITPI